MIFLLEQRFIVCKPLLLASSAFALGRRLISVLGGVTCIICISYMFVAVKYDSYLQFYVSYEVDMVYYDSDICDQTC